MSSSFGQFDLAGFAKSASYWYRAQWLASVDPSDVGRPLLPPEHVVRVSQAWTRPPWENATIDNMIVFSDLPVVELFVNGKSLGVRPSEFLGFASFGNVVYEPGNLTATARANETGPVLATHTQLSPGAPAQLVLTLDAPSAHTGTGSALLLDGHDAALVRATIVDSAGVTVATNGTVSFSIASGPGRVIGVHNGNASSHEPQVASSRAAYHGLARAVVKVTADAVSSATNDLDLLAQIEADCGKECSTDIFVSANLNLLGNFSSIVVSATTPGLPPAKVEIPVSTDARTHSVLATASAAARAGTALQFD